MERKACRPSSSGTLTKIGTGLAVGKSRPWVVVLNLPYWYGRLNKMSYIRCAGHTFNHDKMRVLVFSTSNLLVSSMVSVVKDEKS